MNGLRKFFTLFVVLAVAGFALPAMAGPSKTYDLRMCVGQFANELLTTDPKYNADPTMCATAQSQALGIQTIETYLEARVFNSNPPNNQLAQFSSFDLFVDVNWTAINTQTKPAAVINNSGKWKIDVVQPNHFKVYNLSPVKPQTYVTVKFYVNGFSCGDGRWNVTPYTGSNLSGDTFLPTTTESTKRLTTVACAQLTCNQFITAVQPQGHTDVTSLGYILRLERGINQDGTSGTACSNLFTYQTPNLTSSSLGKYLTTLWDKDQEDSDVAVFSYEVNLEPTASTTGPQKLLEMQVAWLPKPDGTPDFKPALMCETKANFLPVQYTTLVADNGGKITVASSAAVATIAATPFSIVIEQERMLVTKVNMNTNVWTVTRPTEERRLQGRRIWSARP